MNETLEHQESLDELVQMGDSDLQMIDDGIRARINELIKENNIDEDDIKEIYSGVNVSITIIYKKKGTENDEI
jgi:hypothetical protein